MASVLRRADSRLHSVVKMGDPLSIAASITAILQLTQQVIQYVDAKGPAVTDQSRLEIGGIPWWIANGGNASSQYSANEALINGSSPT